MYLEMTPGEQGFTLIEILVSLVLIIFSALFLMKCMIVSLQGVKNSNLRFSVGQELENKKNSILGKKFISPVLDEGSRTERSGDIYIRIFITDISPCLKKIKLKGRKNQYFSSTIFYVSDKIREVK